MVQGQSVSDKMYRCVGVIMEVEESWSSQNVATCPFPECFPHSMMLLFIQVYKWVPVRVEVDIVFEKAFRALLFPGCFSPGS